MPGSVNAGAAALSAGTCNSVSPGIGPSPANVPRSPGADTAARAGSVADAGIAADAGSVAGAADEPTGAVGRPAGSSR
ncbi:hypothetical protein [Actinomadura gamaensis]|uniref:Uncharacterized protein n=1 Tax=Actinomadura gamaensis TaxID=1763541 RepID=A0ABV9TZ39_9ACTN